MIMKIALFYQYNCFKNGKLLFKCMYVCTPWESTISEAIFCSCVQVAKKGHRTGRVATHQCCWGNTWYVMLEEEEMKKTLGIYLLNTFDWYSFIQEVSHDLVLISIFQFIFFIKTSLSTNVKVILVIEVLFCAFSKLCS